MVHFRQCQLMGYWHCKIKASVIDLRAASGLKDSNKGRHAKIRELCVTAFSRKFSAFSGSADLSLTQFERFALIARATQYL